MSFLLEKKLNRWVEAKVIDEKIKNDILQFEDSGPKQNLFMAIMLLGALSIVVGIISVIAANWYLIPKEVKLLVNFTWIAVLCGILIHSDKNQKIMLKEITIFLLFGSILSSIALIGQIYHLESHLFKSLSFWLFLGTPIILFSKTKWPPFVWALSIVLWAFSGLDFFFSQSWRNLNYSSFVPLFLFYLAMFFDRFYKGNRNFSKALYSIGVILFTILVFVFGTNRWADQIWNGQSTSIFVIIGSIPLALMLYRSKSIYLSRLLIFTILFMEIPQLFAHEKLEVLGALTFIGLWLYIAYWASIIKHKILFDFSCLVIAIRIIIIYFEIFGTLLDTGIGLICSGVFILLVAYVWHTKKNKLWLRIKA